MVGLLEGGYIAYVIPHIFSRGDACLPSPPGSTPMNVDKCKVLHFGYKNMSNIYSLGNEVINAENEEKDLGVIVSDTLKPSSQCIAAAKSANKTLGTV